MGAKNSTAFVAASLLASLVITCAAPTVLGDGQTPPAAPKPEAPKPDAPKPDAPKPDAPKPDAPKPDAPKPDAPKPDAPKPTAPKPDAPKPDAPKDPQKDPKKDDVKIMKDYWPGTNIIKFRYELRKDANGKWARNGLGQAYYDHGVLEREGQYKDGVRVGVWKYYDQEGKLLRTEDRGSGKPEAPH
jgi:hypothetical protein